MALGGTAFIKGHQQPKKNGRSEPNWSLPATPGQLVFMDVPIRFANENAVLIHRSKGNRPIDPSDWIAAICVHNHAGHIAIDMRRDSPNVVTRSDQIFQKSRSYPALVQVTESNVSELGRLY